MLFLSGFALYGAMLLVPLYFQQVRGQQAFAAGLLIAAQGVGVLVSRGIAGRLTDRERFVLVLRYRDGLAQKSIADLLGVGEPRVSRSLAGAVDKLRAWGLGTLKAAPGKGIMDLTEVVTLSHALSEFMGSLPPPSDPPSDG